MLQSFEIPVLEFELQLGTGSFGTVFKARDKLKSTTVAVKRTLKLGGLVSREYQILREVLGNEYCVQVLDIFYSLTSEGKCIQHLVFEFLPDNLARFLRSRYRASRPLGYREVSIIFQQVLKGLQFIHSKRIMHRDLKPENILIDPERLTVKICDFGSAKKVGQTQNTPYIVSRYYRAPELIFCNKKYDSKIDIWSAGCIFVELFTGIPLFAGTTEANQFIKQAQVLGPPSIDDVKVLIDGSQLKAAAILNIFSIQKKIMFSELFKNCPYPEVACDFALKMLEYNPCKRLTATECLSHKFFDLE